MQTIRTNLKPNASTQYTNYNHTSMCRFGGVLLGAGPDGLFKLCCGDNDNGTQIDAYFTMLTTDLGASTNKRARFIYFGMDGDGSIQATITGDGKNIIGPYTITADSTEGKQTRRATVTDNKQFTYESLKVNNVDGADFNIDNIKANIFNTSFSI
jgi:hypothetical protein